MCKGRRAVLRDFCPCVLAVPICNVRLSVYDAVSLSLVCVCGDCNDS